MATEKKSTEKKPELKNTPQKKAQENKSAIIVILYYKIFYNYKLVDC